MPLNKKVRKESDVFKELEDLSHSPGYIHAIAYFCFRDNTIRCRSSEALRRIATILYVTFGKDRNLYINWTGM